MKFQDIPEELIHFSVSEKTIDDLNETAFKYFMHRQGMSSYELFLRNLQEDYTIPMIAEFCKFENTNLPISFGIQSKGIKLDHVSQKYTANNCYINLEYNKYSKAYYAQIFYSKLSDLEELLAVFATLPKAKEVKDDFDCAFSYYANGRDYYSSKVNGHDYEDIKANYTPSVQERIETVVNKIKTGNTNGKLIILNGPPGVGKTHLIRSICSQLSDQFSIEFSIEPVSFFSHSSYFIESLISDISDNKGKLVVLEDVDDLLSEDNKERYGDVISKFLNVMDGFIGQGKNFYLIATCNTEEQKLSKAINRPGRCAGYIEFECFNKETATQWFINKGLTTEQFEEKLDKICNSSSKRLGFRTGEKQPITLSEMFNILGDCK